MATNDTTAREDAVTDLEAAADRLDRARERVDEFGESELRELAEVYDSFTGVLERYEPKVTEDGGDYETNIEFQSAIADVLAGVSDDVLLAETFEECDEALKQRWFSESDFEHVRTQLEPVADLVARVEELDAARHHYRERRRNLQYRIREVKAEIDELEGLTRLGNADLDAPTERLRKPIETYNDAVRTAFENFRRDRPARELFAFLEAMEAYPLVPFESPDEELCSYVRSHPPGEEPTGTLVEYADYSRSKLDHYVDDPVALIETVGGRQTYLLGLDAEPLTIAWPPPAATELEWRCRELTAAVNRFAPDVVDQLRAVAALPRETDYDWLRDSVLARENLTDAERERIRSGDVETQLEAERERLARLEATLAEYPDI